MSTSIAKQPCRNDINTGYKSANGKEHCTRCPEQGRQPFVPFSSTAVRTVAIVYTYKCTAKCSHCCLECGPMQDAVVAFELAERCIVNMAEKGCEQVNFTGGECLLFAEDILRLARNARALGLRTGIATNAFWASSANSTANLLSSLSEAGVQDLVVSSDSFHQEYIPLENVLRIVDEAGEYGITVQVEVHRRGARDSQLEEIGETLKEHTRNIKVSSTGPFGRWAQYRYRLGHAQRDRIDVCQSVFDLSVLPNGDVYPCCSGALGGIIRKEQPSLLLLGNVSRSSLGDIIERAQESVLLNALRICGPNGLLDLWCNDAALQDLPPRFCGICDLCIAVCTTLPNHDPSLLEFAVGARNTNDRIRLEESWSERAKLFPEP